MPDAMIRAFLAIGLPETIRTTLTQVIEQFRAQRVSAVRWVPAENIHLTLRFLGSSSTTTLERLAQPLKLACAACPPMEIRLKEVGAFPNQRRPRVVWVGLSAPPALEILYQAVEKLVVKEGFAAEERGFSPHLTLGRVRKDAHPVELSAISDALSNVRVQSSLEFTASRLTLYRSDLRPSGAVYTTLANFDLQG